MVDLETARQIALALPGSEEKPHFGIPSFRVKNKIFATLWIHHDKMMVKLPPIDQSVFNSFDPTVFYPVPNKFGHKGATFIELSKVRPEMLEDALNIAYQAVIAKKR
jgi:hypothetical protein